MNTRTARLHDHLADPRVFNLFAENSSISRSSNDHLSLSLPLSLSLYLSLSFYPTLCCSRCVDVAVSPSLCRRCCVVVVVPHANPRRSRELSSRPEDQFPIIHGTRIYIGNEVINTAFTRRPGRSTCTVDVPGSQGKGSDKFLATVQRFEFPKPFSRYKWTLLPSAGTEGQRNCETTKLPY